MDFNRGNPQAPAPRPAQTGGPVTATTVKNKPEKKSKLIRTGAFVLLLCLVVIVVCVVLLMNFGDTGNEYKAVKKNTLQSVFLNNGQVYFGNIDTKNSTSKYVDLTNIYYLRTNSTGTTSATTGNDVSLVKLGCELHGPYDEMIINRDQVTFWENLKDSGQVAKAIAQYKQQNPDTQKCSTASTGTQQSPSATTPSNTSGNATAPTPTPSKTNGQ
jgi:hypothetical protein